ncbi:MAG: enoyl-CoA hydratase-related protein [Pseudomonadota bacterium]
MTSLPDTHSLKLSLNAGWLSVTLNEPSTRNALTDRLSAELNAVFLAVRNDRTVRGISVRGEGGVFCAGGDLKAFRALSELSDTKAYDQSRQTSLGGAELFEHVHRAPQVVVALIEGAAMAGGLGMACAADFVLATRDAQFAFTETRIGLAPAQIAPYVMQRTGPSVARRLLLLGERFDGTQAHEFGLIDALADDRTELDLLERALKEKVGQCAPGAVGVTKRVLSHLVHSDHDAFKTWAAERFAECVTSEEGREGTRAFFDRRAPAWQSSST